MSQTLAVTEANVRIKLGDTDAGAYGIASERLRDIIRGVARRWANWLGVQELWDGGIYTIAPGDNQDNSGVEYNRILAVRNVVTGRVMTRVSAERMNILRAGELGSIEAVSNPIMGDPTHYTLTDLTGLTYIMVYPRPTASTDLDALVSNVAPETLTDATSYSFSKHAMTGLEAHAAADAAMAMTPDNRNRLGISPESITLWREVAGVGADGNFMGGVAMAETMRLDRMRRVGRIPAQVM